MNKARLIAYTAICSAIATLCIVLSAYVKWVAVIFTVVASVAVCIPLLISNKYKLYSILAYLVSSVVGTMLSTSNIMYCAIIICFAMPMALLKCGMENIGLEQTPQKKRTVLKWILYFVVCEIAIAITVLAMYLVTPAVLDAIITGGNWYLYIILLNVVVPLYDFLLRGTFSLALSAMKKAKIMP